MSVTSTCIRCGQDAFVEFGAGYGCLACGFHGLHLSAEDFRERASDVDDTPTAAAEKGEPLP